MNDTALNLGPFVINASIVTTWGIMLLLLTGSKLLSFKLTQSDNHWRTLAETIYVMIENAVKEVVPTQHHLVTPFIATLWIFLTVANLVGLIPGLHSPTGDLSVTAALAVIVFCTVHWLGVRQHGLKNYLKHYLSPSPILLPFHLISEFTRTLALAIRLFGNIMSLEMAAFLVLIVAGFLVPVPLLMLHIVEALIQAYIFGVLALLYIGAALESNQELSSIHDHPTQEKP